MTKPYFQYFFYHKLLDKYLYLDDNGVIQYSDDPIELRYTPDGWQKKAFAWERDMRKVGLVRTFTIPLSFVLDGKSIVDKIALLESFDEMIELVIKAIETSFPSFPDISVHSLDYVEIYRGELDLPKAEGEENFTKVPIVEGSLDQLLKANEATVYSIPFETYNTIKMDGLFLEQSHSYLIPGYTRLFDHLVGAFHTKHEGSGAGFAYFDQQQENVPSDLTEATNYLFTTYQDISGVRVKGEITIANPFNYHLFLRSDTGTDHVLIPSITALDQTVTKTFDLTFDAEAGRKYFLIALQAGLSPLYTEEARFTISFKSRYRTTYIKSMSLYQLGRELIKRITGSADDFDSDLLQSLLNIQVTSGDAVRGIESAVIKTSWNQYLQAVQALCAAGMGIEAA
ncbi:MAG TPA: hypothetical protein VEA58_08930, partial [Anaerovoracaceae bacterium]|nr:hypothetical protein [Anaerovoracaceae bacterium]